jgi:hypothetical protein
MCSPYPIIINPTVTILLAIIVSLSLIIMTLLCVANSIGLTHLSLIDPYNLDLGVHLKGINIDWNWFVFIPVIIFLTLVICTLYKERTNERLH